MVRPRMTSTLLISAALFAAPATALAQSTGNAAAVNDTAITSNDPLEDGFNDSANAVVVDNTVTTHDDDDDDKDFPWGLLGLLGLAGLLGRKRHDDDIHVDARRDTRSK